MKTSLNLAALFICGLLATNSFGQGSEKWTENYDRLLKKYVTSSGVKYADWKKNAEDMKEIDGVVEAIGAAKVDSLGKKEQLAFYINAYNAWILHQALAKYPTSSVKDLFFTFFTAKHIKVAGQQMSFKGLEDDVIRAKFSDPHVHFALNCASRSCPPLQPAAFVGAQLDAQTEALAKAFINSERGVIYKQGEKSAQLSKIFDWYKGDFAKEGGALDFINKRREIPIPKDAKISYQSYNWSLNEAK
ncbi:MAG: DUF547 domain-containing protein [Verrucomicrobiota bacterium]|nr:DUF547 domain-containing protein [Verrucomicrobiota bacterium]